MFSCVKAVSFCKSYRNEKINTCGCKCNTRRTCANEKTDDAAGPRKSAKENISIDRDMWPGLSLYSTEIVERVKNGNGTKAPYRPAIKESCSGVTNDVVKLMTSCWSEASESRPTFHRLKSMFRTINGGKYDYICVTRVGHKTKPRNRRNVSSSVIQYRYIK